jgi:hypothetical protein
MTPKLNLFLKLILTAFIVSCFRTTGHCQEIPNFSLMFHGGQDISTGFIPANSPGLEGGLGMGIGITNQIDGLWGLDLLTMQSTVQAPITLSLPTPSQPVSLVPLQPTVDIALSVNTRLYLNDKWDFIHERFNTDPYLLVGLGMDLMVDEYPLPPNTPFYSASYDILFGMNLGAGIDIPVDKTWFFYAEGLDHLVVWQGLTQVYILRGGFKVMLDSAHVDPFR